MGLSACLSLGPLVPTGEEKEWRLHLSAPALTCTENQECEQFEPSPASRPPEKLRCHSLKKLGALSSGVFLLCPPLPFLAEGHSQHWMAATEPQMAATEPQMAVVTGASRTAAKEAATACQYSLESSELTLTRRSPPPPLSQMHGRRASFHLQHSAFSPRSPFTTVS